ncbi:MAG: QueT transporter family protein [Clostridia bacterium]|jgi:transporter|nr:QueT transporter family protein [Clostridia bacterium]
MKGFFTAKRLCRAGIIAALYVALTYSFGAIAYNGFLQIRPAEALCILPLFFPEAVPALYIGCMLSNLGSPFLVYDVFIGSLATLFAALGTYLVGRFFKKHALKLFLGGLFPVLLNAFVIPVVIVFLCGDLSYGTKAATYWTFVGSLAATEAVWVYALGAPLYFFIERMRKKNVSAFSDKNSLYAAGKSERQTTK